MSRDDSQLCRSRMKTDFVSSLIYQCIDSEDSFFDEWHTKTTGANSTCFIVIVFSMHFVFLPSYAMLIYSPNLAFVIKVSVSTIASSDLSNNAKTLPIVICRSSFNNIICMKSVQPYMNVQILPYWEIVVTNFLRPILYFLAKICGGIDGGMFYVVKMRYYDVATRHYGVRTR